MRKRMDGGLSITTIEKMLENVRSPKSYTTLRMTSTPIEHRGFTRYLDWCKERDFMVWKDLIANNGHMIKEYTLSQKGREFLEIIK